jgi:hypothetical protein
MSLNVTLCLVTGEAPSIGGVGNFSEGTFAPLHLRRGRLVPPRARRLPIPGRRVVTGRGMGSRRIDPGRSLPGGGLASGGAGLRRGRPAAEPDHTPGAKHASRRAGHLLPIVGVVRGPGARHEVRPSGQLWIRPRTSRPRSTGDPRAWSARCLLTPRISAISTTRRSFRRVIVRSIREDAGARRTVATSTRRA